jgi:hypothetical protein
MPMGGKMSDDRHMLIKVRKVDREEADRIRAQVTACFLQWVMSVKKRMDPATWLNVGGPEGESFVEALAIGGAHPLLEHWQATRKALGNPPPPLTEIRARRLAVLLAVALKRAGYGNRSMEDARRFAAQQMGRAGVFAKPPTAGAIAHWQERQQALSPWDEQLVATALASCGVEAPHRLAHFFVGLAHYASNPTAVAVRDP